jgi:hypothetical protein
MYPSPQWQRPRCHWTVIKENETKNMPNGIVMYVCSRKKQKKKINAQHGGLHPKARRA